MKGMFGYSMMHYSIKEYIREQLEEEIKLCIDKVKSKVENKIRSATGAICIQFLLSDFKYNIEKNMLTINVNYKNIGVE